MRSRYNKEIQFSESALFHKIYPTALEEKHNVIRMGKQVWNAKLTKKQEEYLSKVA